MIPVPQTRSMLEVLRIREQKRRLALARLARHIARERSGIEAADTLIAAVKDRLHACLDARFATGSRSVAALAEVEAHAKNLRARAEELLGLRQKSEQALEELLVEQRASAKLWRHSEAALGHVQSIARRGLALREVRRAELEEQEWR